MSTQSSPAPTSPAPVAKPAAIAPNPTAPTPTPPPAPPRPKVLSYWRKEIATNQFYIGGKPVPFEVLDGNRGVLVLDPENPAHVPIIAALSEAADKQRGGIRRSSLNEFETLKKTYPLTASSQFATRSQDEKLKIAPRAGMEGKAFRPPPPKGVSQPKPNSAAPADTKAAPAADVIDGVLQAPNPVPDFVPRLGKVGAAAAKDPPGEN